MTTPPIQFTTVDCRILLGARPASIMLQQGVSLPALRRRVLTLASLRRAHPRAFHEALTRLWAARRS